jgi:hypothetical protein
MNCDNLFTVKAMSGRVIDRYCRAPIILRYSVGSENTSPSKVDKIIEVDIEVQTGFASAIFVLCKMSSI